MGQGRPRGTAGNNKKMESSKGLWTQLSGPAARVSKYLQVLGSLGSKSQEIHGGLPNQSWGRVRARVTGRGPGRGLHLMILQFTSLNKIAQRRAASSTTDDATGVMAAFALPKRLLFYRVQANT